MAVGMNTDIYDKDLLFRMSGSSIISIFDRFNTYITKCQQQNPNLYIEFQDLVNDFKERKRMKPSENGNMRHS